MISSAQIRAGRGLVKWTQAMLAAKAGVSVVTMNMIESDNVVPRERTVAAIRDVLEKAGVEFIGENGKSAGVRFAK